MQYRRFGKTSLLVSEIGFGAWAIGGNAMVGNTPIGWGRADDATSMAAIRSALDAGINFFDTADIYGLGHSEDLLGAALGTNKDVIIATKAGNVSRDGAFSVDYSKEHIMKACEASLRRLKRDSIDYYQLHSARLVHLQQGDCIEAMQELKTQGKVRYWGLSLNSFHPEPEATFLMMQDMADGFQLVFNVINQRAYDVIRKAAGKDYGIIARMPLQFGLLTGKLNEQSRFTKDDHRSKRLQGEILSGSLSLLKEFVWPLAVKEKMSETALALSFILSFKEISTAITGIRTPEQALQNTTGLKKLAGSTLDELLRFGNEEAIALMDAMEKAG